MRHSEKDKSVGTENRSVVTGDLGKDCLQRESKSHCVSVPISLFSPTLIFLFLNYRHPSGCGVVSHCRFDLYFSND